MNHANIARPNLRRLACATSALVMVTGEAVAQTTAPAQQPSQVEEVVVTGSRIVRAGFDTLEPATVVAAERLADRGATNVGEVLRTTPGFAAGQSSLNNQSQFSPGALFVDRFGLGSGRTLTLVNGRRHVSTNPPTVQGNIVGGGNPAGVQVDLNIIPTIMVERVENLAVGGAPTYGSDAIAGVVNVILRQRFEGARISSQAGITERGDNQRFNISALAGRNFAEDRGNAMVALSFDSSQGVNAWRRDINRRSYLLATNPLATSATANIAGRTAANDGRINPNIPFNTGPADGIPNAVFIQNSRIPGINYTGVLSPIGSPVVDSTLRTPGFGPTGQNRLMFNAAGEIVPYNPGSPFTAVVASGGDGFELRLTQPISADVQRKSVNFNVSYNLTPAVTAFLESNLFRSSGREIAEQPVYNSPLFGGRTIPNGPMLFSVNDPRLSAEARATLVANGITDFNLSRAIPELGNLGGRVETTVKRAVVGLRGEVGLGRRTFNYEVSYNQGQTLSDNYATEVNQQRFVNAINVRQGPGSLVCDPTPTRNVASGALSPVADAACVPLNVFGNNVTAAAVSYVTFQSNNRSLLEQTDFLATIASSNLFSVWGADPVGFSAGVQRRREYGKFTPDRLISVGAARNTPFSALSGELKTKEIFGELLVPLVSPGLNFPLVNTLEAEGRIRYVDNSLNGGFTTYTAGGRYRPVADLEFRGNYTRSLRAPAIPELFTPQAEGRSTFPDPCDSRNVSQGAAPTVRARNCAAFYQSYGITGTFNSRAIGITQPSRQGGNPNLTNEKADSYTFGVVLRPRFLPKFQAAVDWSDIRITDNIAALSAGEIGSGCYDNPNFDIANPDAGNSFCTLFRRVRGGTDNGQIAIDPVQPGITTTFVNGAFTTFAGLSAVASYSDIPLDGLGLGDSTLNIDGSLFYVDKLCSSNNGVVRTCTQGTNSNPRYTAQLNLSYRLNDFRANLEVNYRPQTKFDLLFTNESQDILKLPEQFLFNTAVSYQVNEATNVQVTVTNIFDSEPLAPTLTGDSLGRRYTLRINRNF
ncbi:MAG: TonB-dependent receptor [Phenylobacterium sp.]|uniref:TonB-dependent receptor domain-containing protein n=1 Tax=Phenylobacterium sp. TaxID=1871053 RepID=UPI0025F61D54|nr:TonB-dependent receptor [Phenylobacterium sp.]MCG9917539.1 TonB-dependent receptor [Phenylobacterium sp.]